MVASLTTHRGGVLKTHMGKGGGRGRIEKYVGFSSIAKTEISLRGPGSRGIARKRSKH